MNFTKILANPPYLGSLGGKIMSFVHEEYLNSEYVILQYPKLIGKILIRQTFGKIKIMTVLF